MSLGHCRINGKTCYESIDEAWEMAWIAWLYYGAPALVPYWCKPARIATWSQPVIPHPNPWSFVPYLTQHGRWQSLSKSWKKHECRLWHLTKSHAHVLTGGMS